MKKIGKKLFQKCTICIVIFVIGFITPLFADIPQDAQTAADNAKTTGILKILAEAAKARGDYLTCAALAKEADRVATMTDILKQQVIAEFNQLTPAQQNQVRGDKENVIADATITRQDADAIQDCYKKVMTFISIFILFLFILFLWLLWKAFGPFFQPKEK